MILIQSFQVPFNGETIYAESTFGRNGHILMLHGGGKDRKVFYKYRVLMDELGVGTTVFDFLGHGETGGDMHESSLFSRTMQAKAVIAYQGLALTGCMGVSMGAYNALQLSKEVRLQSLILMVPGVYSMPAYKVNFGPDFSAIIRQFRNWEETDAWDIAAEFTGNLLVIAAENDTIIPSEIPKRLVSSASRTSQKKLLTIPDAGHNNIWQNLMFSPDLYEKVCSAFDECLVNQIDRLPVD
ncbi:alpha/beta hydrolase [Klebsiella indica]|uniref:Alpha/beta hydrolase n=1 Tax=Klebsiella indica TaxID=2582917 RepID=A0A5R9LK47_9ENTR|nr:MULTISPECIES: alpha/beta hydrolase [Klebsiella]TLV19967.1 alpha/beta hydrolase [Klebsiella indica]